MVVCFRFENGLEWGKYSNFILIQFFMSSQRVNHMVFKGEQRIYDKGFFNEVV